LGNVLLLCKFPYNPLLSSSENTSDVASAKQSTASEKTDLRRGCVNVEKGEARRYDPT
jgi:hypothetical protein